MGNISSLKRRLAAWYLRIRNARTDQDPNREVTFLVELEFVCKTQRFLTEFQVWGAISMLFCRLVLFGFAGLWAAESYAASGDDAFAILHEADRLSDLFNWADARPLYTQAEDLFAASGDQRNALCAKVGRIRGSMETLNLPETSDYLGSELQSPLLQNDLRLRLMCLIVKGDIDGDIEWSRECGLAGGPCDRHEAQR
jgi:hypothetical protein